MAKYQNFHLPKHLSLAFCLHLPKGKESNLSLFVPLMDTPTAVVQPEYYSMLPMSFGSYEGRC